MSTMSTVIPEYDDKIRLAIGNLLSKADPLSKTVLTAFDSSKDVSANQTLLGGPRFQLATLNACALFLKIKTEEPKGNRIFSNKPSLAKRIILEIQSLYPAICPDCNIEYSTQFDSDPTPAVCCFLCLQGCHDCDSFQPRVSSATSVWLCKACYETNLSNQLQAKSKAPSKLASKQQSGANTPSSQNQKQHIPLDQNELQKKLSLVKAQENEQHSANDDKSQLPNLRLDEICSLLKLGKCPHGVSGKTPSNDQSACKMFHPPRCSKFIKNSTHKKFGCRRGDKCKFCHPQHCPTSLSDKSCYDEDCLLVHIVGTKRHKPKERESYRRDISGNRTSNDQRNRGNNNSKRTRSSSQSHTKSTPQHENKDFLEIRSLLTNFQTTFQKEIENIKSSIVTQENRIASFFPSANQHIIRQFVPHGPPSQNMMFQHPVPQFQPQNRVPPPPANWSNILASGC